MGGGLRKWGWDRGGLEGLRFGDGLAFFFKHSQQSQMNREKELEAPNFPQNPEGELEDVRLAKRKEKAQRA